MSKIVVLLKRAFLVLSSLAIICILSAFNLLIWIAVTKKISTPTMPPERPVSAIPFF